MSRQLHIEEDISGKEEELVRYLEEDHGYWKENDIWDIRADVFKENGIKTTYRTGMDSIVFLSGIPEKIKNEMKYYILYSIKNKHFSVSLVLNELQYAMKYFAHYVKVHHGDKESLEYVEIDNAGWRLYLINKGISLNQENQVANTTYRYIGGMVTSFIRNYYDEREETEKDIWDAEKIAGSKIPASGAGNGGLRINFSGIPACYREMVKRYFRTIVTKRSFSHCHQMLTYVGYFFETFYKQGYADGFLENLSREDVEKYVYWFGNEHNGQNATYKSKFISYIRTFLEYIELAQYEQATRTEVSRLLFQSDIPRRENNREEVQKARFIPEPVMNQLDAHIKELDRPQCIPFYVLLRETGWRGTDILNLRYHDCLEEIWNVRENSYNYYLCGEITKTGIARLKIPIHEEVGMMLKPLIELSKELSTEENNPQKYLFNVYEGKRKGKPIKKHVIVGSVERLIRKKDIRGGDGELYHFKMHGLRHTRAKEYVEQGLGISVVQQMLGHQSLQMTVHYATVSENTLYEKWKQTEKLDLFNVKSADSEAEKEMTDEKREEAVRYEYVRKNLDAVKVPFGVCHKPLKLACKQQMQHCLECGSFCTTKENIAEYESEIEKVKCLIDVSEKNNRIPWIEKNQQYLNVLEEKLSKIKESGIIHKNGSFREES